MTISAPSNLRSRVAVVTLILATAADVARAQRLAELPAGTQFRVRVEGDPVFHHGTFVGFHADSIAFQEPARLHLVARDKVRVLDWRDRDASRARHAVVGGLIGGVALGVPAVSENSKCTGFCVYHPAAVGAVAGGVGLLIGAGVGALLPVERWHAVKAPLQP